MIEARHINEIRAMVCWGFRMIGTLVVLWGGIGVITSLPMAVVGDYLMESVMVGGQYSYTVAGVLGYGTAGIVPGLGMAIAGVVFALLAEPLSRRVITMPASVCPGCGYAGSVKGTCPECGLGGLDDTKANEADVPADKS